MNGILDKAGKFNPTEYLTDKDITKLKKINYNVKNATSIKELDMYIEEANELIKKAYFKKKILEEFNNKKAN